MIDRVSAYEDRRQLDVSLAAQSAEGFKDMSARLDDQMGEVVRHLPVFEVEKLGSLMDRIAEEDEARGKV